MIGLKGRPEVTPTIEEVRELTVEEVLATPRSRVPRVKSLRDSHHMVARLIATGLRNFEIAERTGYSISGITVLLQDPSFQELVSHYREVITDEWKGSIDEYFTTLVTVRNKALRQISDQLDDAERDGLKLPLNQLHTIHSDGADRTGYPKRKETVNLNLDFADKLDAAVRRSRAVKQIEGQSTPVAIPPSGAPAPEQATGSSADGAERGAETGLAQPSQPPTFPKELLPQPRLRRA